MNRQQVVKHLAGWAGLYLLWITLFQHRTLVLSRTLTVEFCYLLFIAANYYFQSMYAIPRLLYKGRYWTFGLALAGGVAITALLRVPLVIYMNRHFFQPAVAPPPALDIWYNSMLNILVWTGGLVAGKLMADKIRLRQYLEKAEKEQVKNELALLKAQLNPHFLFNSINSIYGHIDKTNPTARTMLLSFSEMLRYQLYECNTESIAIDKEISYIRNYMALQQARKEESLVIRLDIKEEVKACSVAPLLFITFIENAFKYVSSSEQHENRVEVLLDKKDDQLVFRTFNTKDRVGSTFSQNGNGIGLANVKRRLELLYPGRHRLELENGNDHFEVNLTLHL